jgi:hypothetical protein
MLSEAIMRLVQRAENDAKLLRGKKWEQMTPEEVGRICGHLEGMIALFRQCEEHGMFRQEERLRLLEEKLRVLNELNSRADPPAQDSPSE